MRRNVTCLPPLPLPSSPQAATGVIGHVPAALRSDAVFYYVNVTNTGSVDSDEVVLGFLVPPGAGTNGVPLQVMRGGREGGARQRCHGLSTPYTDISHPCPPLQELFGFERVHVPAGQTVTVYLGAQGVRFTQADGKGVRRVLRGDYTVRFGVRETAAYGGGFLELPLRAQ